MAGLSSLKLKPIALDVDALSSLSLGGVEGGSQVASVSLAASGSCNRHIQFSHCELPLGDGQGATEKGIACAALTGLD